MGGNSPAPGTLLNCRGVTLNDLSRLSPVEGPENTLGSFLSRILEEAVPFVDSIAPKAGPPEQPLWKSCGTKKSPSSIAPVQILDRFTPLSKERWFARLSKHADSTVKGSASMEEFYRDFKQQHPETERAFTPDVVGARRAQSWECGNMNRQLHGETWGSFTLDVVEMCHKVGRPILQDRTFTVLQMTCSRIDSTMSMQNQNQHVGESADGHVLSVTEFLVVSIPVYDFDKSDLAELSKRKNVVIGSYVSVERFRKLSENVEWIMATSSDAKGFLPQFIQNPAIPSQIAKDVFLYMDWIARERVRVMGET